MERRITTKDGTIMFLVNGKLHNEKGPAVIPEGNDRKREYYLNGIQYSEKEWKIRIKQNTGLPFYKQSGNKVRH